MVGIGLEELGVDEFVKGQFFDGDLFIDTKKQCYKDLGYKRYGFLNVLGAVFSKSSREMIDKAKKENISGDLKGDGFQNGGTLVISQGGEKVLLSYRQENLADHVALVDVLNALGIQGDKESASATFPEVTCDDDVCYTK